MLTTFFILDTDRKSKQTKGLPLKPMPDHHHHYQGGMKKEEEEEEEHVEYIEISARAVSRKTHRQPVMV